MNIETKQVNIIISVVILLIVAAGLSFFVFGSTRMSTDVITPTPVVNTNDLPSAPSQVASDDIKSYENAKFGYSVQYPKNWYIDTTYSNEDFSLRGPEEQQIFMAGDTQWSNYSDMSNFTPDNIPADLEIISLYIYKSPSAVSVDKFIESQNYKVVEKANKTISGTEGRRVVIFNSEDQIHKSVIYLFRQGERMFVFGSSGSEKSVEVLDQMMSNFKFN